MWNYKGRSGYGDQSINGNYDDWSGLSMNGRQWKNELTGETRQLAGADFWHKRKELSPNHPAENIRWDSYKCPGYYHLPRKPKPVVENTIENVQTAEENETLCIDKKEKVSVFLTLREDNIFRKIYEKYFVR